MESLRKLKLLLVLVFGFWFQHFSLFAQVFKHDSAYYKVFPAQVTSRFYFSRKYTGVDIKDRLKEMADLKYRPNSTLNMGVGASYHSFNVNLAYGFGFLNPEKGKGKTNYLDLQTHIYPNKLAIDGFLQLYKGFHLTPEGRFAGQGQRYFYRPDMKVREIGASVKYVFNAKNFSYRAAFLQTEWQKKSAGTFLAGLECYGGNVKDDDSLVPPDEGVRSERNFNALRFFEFGPNLGYAYTLVVKRHYFIMGSATANLGLGHTVMKNLDERKSNWGVNANYLFKGSVGYNSLKWAINANYVLSTLRLTKTGDFSGRIVTGNYRFNFIYRFMPSPKVRKVLDVFDPYSYF